VKKLTVIIFLFFFALQVKSQIILEANAGYGSYNLSDIKKMQKDMLEIVNFPNLKSVETFPNNLFYSLHLIYPYNQNNQLGLYLSYSTTGGRNHLSDYSGEYKLDMIINGYRVGAEYQYYFFEHQKLRLSVQGTGGIIASFLKMNEKLVVFDAAVSDNKKNMKGFGVFLEPSLKISYCIMNHLNLNFRWGYEFDLGNDLFLDNQKTKIESNWSGVRLSLGVAYYLAL